MALVDLFCCNGGFSLGAHRAGFQVSAAYDLDPVLTSAFKANFKDTELKLGDISELSGDLIRQQVGKRITGVFGGPPCQGFSSIGRRDPMDPRRKLLRHFFRLVSELQPDFFIMENVKGLAYKTSRGELDDALALLDETYNLIGPLLLDAADFGAATRRTRLFVIGTHRNRADTITLSDINRQMRNPVTVEEAISDLVGARRIADHPNGLDRWRLTKAADEGSYAARMRAPSSIISSHRTIEHRPDVAQRFASVPQGGTDPIGRHPRLAWSGQCPTLRAGTGSDKGSYQAVRPIHPSKPRVITVREAARLQGFPDQHIFHPTTWHSFRMIGNSVSPVMAEALFTALAEKFDAADVSNLAA
ncbi:DNA cytosine methyltransferase [Brevundimonas sp.]|uniref:DNA cytosine methyltransferase n=1 Tax=Brevundimonas sp. TaxID=1871086 RepID=UPI00289A2A2C|nr:DNA cytosine methyltransferase [Brevundimonas sp.]